MDAGHRRVGPGPLAVLPRGNDPLLTVVRTHHAEWGLESLVPVGLRVEPQRTLEHHAVLDAQVREL